MKHILFTAFVFLVIPMQAMAQNVSADQLINGYISDYKAAFATCDSSTVAGFIDRYYAPDYTMTLKAPNGQMRQATQSDLKTMAKQAVDTMRQVNGPNGDCTPDITLDQSNFSGQTGVIRTTQREEITIPQNGQMVGIRANTTCMNQVALTNNNLQLLKSECVLYQEQ